MAAMDFPASPAVGDRYPTTAVAGQTQYVWDGEKWATAGSAGIDQAAADARYVNVAGDTMTGDLKIQKIGAAIVLDTAATNDNTAVYSTRAAVPRWGLFLGTSAAESGNNTGSDFALFSYNDAGTNNHTPLQIGRNTGIADFEKKPTVAGQVWAAPIDALAYSGMQVNGGMEVNQERGLGSFPLTNGALVRLADVWPVSYSHAAGTSVFAASATAGGLLTPSNVFAPNMLVLGASTAMTSVAAGDWAYLAHFIEGYRVARLAWGTASAQPVTIGFFIYSGVAGTMTVSTHNSANDRSYVAEVAITAAAWQYKTVTIPGCTDGNWFIDQRNGMSVFFSFACGTNFQTPAGSWATGNKLGTPGSSNFFATTNSIYLTNVVILPGTEAPPAARSGLMRPYDQELLTCKRYWYGCTPLGHYAYIVVAGDTSRHYQQLFPVQMRATPTVVVNWNTGSTVGVESLSPHGFAVNTSAGDTLAARNVISWTADARL